MEHIRSILVVSVAAAVFIIVPLAATGHWKSEKVEDKTDECKWGRNNYVYLPSDEGLRIRDGGSSDCHLSGITFTTDDIQSYWKYAWSAVKNGIDVNTDAKECTSSMCTEFKALAQSKRLEYCRGLCDCDQSCIGYDYFEVNEVSSCSMFKIDMWHSSCTIEPTSLVKPGVILDSHTKCSAATVGPIPPTPSPTPPPPPPTPPPETSTSAN